MVDNNRFDMRQTYNSTWLLNTLVRLCSRVNKALVISNKPKVASSKPLRDIFYDNFLSLIDVYIPY